MPPSAALLFLSSPFSIEAVDLLERVGVQVWKIASGEVTHMRCSSTACSRRARPFCCRRA